jgi:glucose/arabinose dehydrogenase
MQAYSMRLTVFLAAAVLAPTLIAQSVAGGFVIETVVNPVTSGRAMAFAPDGRLFYTEFVSGGTPVGRIMVVDNPTTTPGTPVEFATVSGFVAPGGNDLGVHGIVLHPSFPIAAGDATNRYVYVCHTTGTPGAPQLVVKRFTEDTTALGTALPASETTIISSIDMGSAGANFGGRIAFGPDGLLYAGVGDGGSAVSLAGGFAQDTVDRRGKILRYQADGSIPLNNPISGNPMFARGLRNPRAIAFNTTTADCFCVDSGNPPTNGADELNVVLSDGNYGWSAAGGSGNLTNPAFSNPAWVLSDTFEPGAVAFYPTAGTAFPAIGYRGAVAYVGSEAASGAIHRVVLTGSNERAGIAAWPLASGFSAPVRDLKFGPDGNLYVMTDGVIYRIRFTGNTSPSTPVANAGTDQTVDENDQVTLTGANSFDADVSDVLRFTWRQVGGGTLVTLTNPTTASPTFTAPGVSFTQNYTFELIVEDGNGGVANDFVIVAVTNTGNDGGSSGPKSFEAQGEGGCSVGRSHSGGLALLMLMALVAGFVRPRKMINRQ